MVPPVVFHPDRSADFELVGANPALQRLLDRIPEPIDAEVWRLTTAGPSLSPFIDRLTDRKRQLLTVAVNAGYYEEPRKATLEEIAAEVDLATTTVAEHVRKGETQLVKHVLTSDLSVWTQRSDSAM